MSQEQYQAMHEAIAGKPPGTTPSLSGTPWNWVVGAAIFCLGLGVGLHIGKTPQAVPAAAPVAAPADSAFDAFVDRVAREEGFRATVYRDNVGVAIGYGFNLTTGGYPTDLIDQWLAGGITEPDARAELAKLLRDRMDALSADWPPYAAQSPGIQFALADASYELGEEGLLSFRDMLRDISLHDAVRAAADIRSSRWYTQEPVRAETLIDAIQQGL